MTSAQAVVFTRRAMENAVPSGRQGRQGRGGRLLLCVRYACFRDKRRALAIDLEILADMC